MLASAGFCRVVKGGLRVHLVPKVAHSAIGLCIQNNVQRLASPDEEGADRRLMVVRHPLDRIVSGYAFFTKVRKPFNHGMKALGYREDMSFGEWLDHLLEVYPENVHTRPQIDFTGGYEIDYLIPIEKLSEAWPVIAAKYGLPTITMYNSSEHKAWQTYYTPEQQERAEAIFAEDIDLYNLAWEKYNGKHD